MRTIKPHVCHYKVAGLGHKINVTIKNKTYTLTELASMFRQSKYFNMRYSVALGDNGERFLKNLGMPYKTEDDQIAVIELSSRLDMVIDPNCFKISALAREGLLPEGTPLQ